MSTITKTVVKVVKNSKVGQITTAYIKGGKEAAVQKAHEVNQ